MFVISGATGHVGSVVATELLAKKQRIRVIVRSPEKGRGVGEAGGGGGGRFARRSGLPRRARCAVSKVSLRCRRRRPSPRPTSMRYQRELADTIAAAVGTAASAARRDAVVRWRRSFVRERPHPWPELSGERASRNRHDLDRDSRVHLSGKHRSAGRRGARRRHLPELCAVGGHERADDRDQGHRHACGRIPPAEASEGRDCGPPGPRVFRERRGGQARLDARETASGRQRAAGGMGEHA